MRDGRRIPRAGWAVLCVSLFVVGLAVGALAERPAAGSSVSTGVAVVPRGGGPLDPTPSTGGPNTVIATIATNSGGIEGTFDPANGDIYIPTGVGLWANENTSNTTVISGATNTVVGQAFLGTLAYAQTPTYAPSNEEVYVADQNETVGPDNVTAYSGVDTIAANVDTGYTSYPSTPVYDPVNHYLYVSDTESYAPLSFVLDNVTVINTLTNSVVTQIPVGYDPETGVYDPADGDIYVPVNNAGSGDNISIINATTNTVLASPGGFNGPITPAYDPINQEVYFPNEGVGAYNITVVKGLSVVENISTGTDNDDLLYGSPTVDPINGDVYEVLLGPDEMGVISPTTNTFVHEVSAGVNSYANFAPTWDPVDQEMYAPGYSFYGGTGGVIAINTTTFDYQVIDVGGAPQTPTFDSTNDDLYVPNDETGNVSVINGGVSTTPPPPPGEYKVSFTETGLPTGAWWVIEFNGSTENVTASSYDFGNFHNTSAPGDPYDLESWYSEATCTFTGSSRTGDIEVDGHAVDTTLPFSCSSSTPPPPSSSSSSSGFLGLPGDEGYLLIGGIVAAIVVVAVVLMMVKRGPSRPSGPAPPPPPAVWSPPPPPPPPPPLPPP